MNSALALSFVAAQGAAVFICAYVAAAVLRTRSWAAKTLLMAASFSAWVAFTFWLMFWGANSYLVFFGVVEAAAISSALYWLAWIALPLLRASPAESKLTGSSS